MNLRNQILHDFHTAVHVVASAQDFGFAHVLHHTGNFMQDQLEPEFIGLMNDDKKQLVVMGGTSLRDLERKKFWNF